jgi:hypothetical protein
MSWTEEQYAEFLRNKNMPACDVKTQKPNKFHAVMCEADGIKFRSKKERRRYLELMALQNAGECWFLRQVPFYLPGNTKYVLDFLVFWKDGRQTFEDSKGKKTPMYIMKKKQVEALYPVRIVEP